jgi:hypothetical protein
LFVIVSNNLPQHVVTAVQTTCIDADGVSGPYAMLKKMRDQERLNAPVLRPFTSSWQRLAIDNDIVCNWLSASKLELLLHRRFGSPSEIDFLT